MDFFTVPTATFRALFVLVILSHDRRRVDHLNVTDHPTAIWTRQQIREAFPDETAPTYLLRDRDSSYGPDFGRLLQSFGTEELVIAPRAPWQNPYVERLIGTLRRECLIMSSCGMSDPFDAPSDGSWPNHNQGLRP
jgi:hypothetical protein